MYGVTIAELIEKMDFKNLTPELDCEKIVVSHPDVNRPRFSSPDSTHILTMSVYR